MAQIETATIDSGMKMLDGNLVSKETFDAAGAGLNLAGLLTAGNLIPGLGIAGFGLGLISSAMQKEAQNEMIEKQKQVAMQNFALKQTALAKQFDNYKAQAAMDDFNQEIQTGKALGSSKVAAASSGISGTTTSNVISNIRMQNAINDEIRKRNVTQVAQNIESQSASDYLNLTQTVENLDSQKMDNFDVLMGGIGMGMQGLSMGQNIAGSIQASSALEQVNILEQ